MGTIVKTATGLIHYASYQEEDVAETPIIVKRGRGRPRKETSEASPKYDFSAFLTKVKVPTFKGNVTVHRMKG